MIHRVLNEEDLLLHLIQSNNDHTIPRGMHVELDALIYCDLGLPVCFRDSESSEKQILVHVGTVHQTF